ncbi:ABC1 family-domain-containing protein [Chytridium lagenaria]|nr:ABC1 family-domain-containing protein [Chytridium lagenaria]
MLIYTIKNRIKHGYNHLNAVFPLFFTHKAARSIIHQEAAEWLLWLARTQGGIYVKAAQHIASLTYVVPSEFTTTLSVLQDRAPFRPWAVMSSVLKHELQVSDLSQVFLDISETPIAAASLAQVHKAITRDNEAVAVKIQYPDVARLFTVDTSTMQLLSDLANLFFQDFSFGWIVTEFKSSLSTEFDFTHEARNAAMTHERFASSTCGGAMSTNTMGFDIPSSVDDGIH